MIDGKVDGFAIPISGKGLWGTMYGYFAIEPDGATAKGITFYKHVETPRSFNMFIESNSFCRSTIRFDRKISVHSSP